MGRAFFKIPSRYDNVFKNLPLIMKLNSIPRVNTPTDKFTVPSSLIYIFFVLEACILNNPRFHRMVNILFAIDLKFGKKYR